MASAGLQVEPPVEEDSPADPPGYATHRPKKAGNPTPSDPPVDSTFAGNLRNPAVSHPDRIISIDGRSGMPLQAPLPARTPGTSSSSVIDDPPQSDTTSCRPAAFVPVDRSAESPVNPMERTSTDTPYLARVFCKAVPDLGTAPVVSIHVGMPTQNLERLVTTHGMSPDSIVVDRLFSSAIESDLVE